MLLWGILAILVHLFSYNSTWVERYYSTGVYPYIGILLRKFNSYIPFSIGDILYCFVFLWFFALCIQFFLGLVNRSFTWEGTKEVGIKTLHLFLKVYVVFNVLWGLNYNRKGIGHQLGLQMDTYSTQDLKKLNEVLLEKVNSSKQITLKQTDVSTNNKKIFETAAQAYTKAAKAYPFLYHENAKSVKKSMWGWLGNYGGFTGYYNPFTGEAQVNGTIPNFIKKYTTCHEMAHQIGYAKESEANFVGYLAASQSADTSFQYSVYLDLFLYSNRNLYQFDSTAAKEYATLLMPEVKDDLRIWRSFLFNYKGPVEPVVRWIYGKYLQRNQQPSGVLSYDEVSSFLIAYMKKYGTV